MNTSWQRQVVALHHRPGASRSGTLRSRRLVSTAVLSRRLLPVALGVFAAIGPLAAVAQEQAGPAERAPDAAVASASGQEIYPLSAGSRVRILSHVPGVGPRVGEIVESDSTLLHLTLRGGRGESLSWDLVREVQVLSRGRSYAPAIGGLLIGAAAGFYLRKVQLDAQYEQDSYNGLVAAVQGAPIGGAIGLFIGFAVGGEKWRTVGTGPYLIPSR